MPLLHTDPLPSEGGESALRGIIALVMKVNDFITVDPEICHGKPCFRGTRIMAASVLELLESGQTIPQILEAYPNLTRQHIQAALHLASELLEHDQFVPFRSA